mmetsp:Transcript_13551/g.13284  ORF Transcript_13551/g.13284 Transcript_13551/m.13284 type:complete len:102 (-) Transcript_13551:169-474(-)
MTVLLSEFFTTHRFPLIRTIILIIFVFFNNRRKVCTAVWELLRHLLFLIIFLFFFLIIVVRLRLWDGLDINAAVFITTCSDQVAGRDGIDLRVLLTDRGLL